MQAKIKTKHRTLFSVAQSFGFFLSLSMVALLLLCTSSQVAYAWPGDLSVAWSSPEVDVTQSVDWGDWDGDGDLDLAVGNGVLESSTGQPNRVYENVGGNLVLIWTSPEADITTSVDWGDWDGDGDLDLAVGNGGTFWDEEPNRVYENVGDNLVLAWSSPITESTTSSVAWGDWDNDGDLDLAMGNWSFNWIYENEGGSLTLAWTSPEWDYTTSVAWGDWDGDNDLDLAVGNWGPNRVYENTGDDLVLTWTSPENSATKSVAWGDWDGDDDLDLAVGNGETIPGSSDRVYENVGGDLVLAWTSAEDKVTTSVDWGDWDGDGDLDLAVGRGVYSRGVAVYENVGDSLFLAWTSIESDYTNSVAWGDWDGDGDLDLAVGNQEQPNRVYENTEGNLSLAWSSSELDFTTSVAWGDWDGDGDLDLAVGNQEQPNRVYENTEGNLSLAWSSPELDFTTSVAWGDWDSDGDLDLAVGNRGGYHIEPNRVYENTEGNLSLAWSSPELDLTTSVAWGDWDGDNDLDLAVGNGGSNRVYENTGSNLSLAWTSIESDYTTSVVWGDVDGDGDLDLTVGNGTYSQGQPNRVYENVGGSLSLTWSSPDSDNTRSVAWGDWDGDGDLDLAVGNTAELSRVYENVGGSLALAWFSLEPGFTTSVAWGDWDGDGDLDLAVGNGTYSQGQPNRVYENAGGSLSLAWSSSELDYTLSMAWGDWDGDGDLDLAVGNRKQPNQVYENTGSNLSLIWSSSELDSTTSVAWGDWDGDGDLDLAVGNGGSSPEPNRVYENTRGNLSLAWSSPELDDTYSVAWGDWDGDGDLDLAVGNGEQPNRVYENVGGSLSLVWSSLETEYNSSVAWGDWDGDGDLDLAMGNWVYKNVGDNLVSARFPLETDYTTSVAWGDWDGDGDLDLAVGKSKQPNRVYENIGGSLSLAWSSPGPDQTTSVAWEDWDGNGDLDLAVGNWYMGTYGRREPRQVYENVGGSLALVWSSSEIEDTGSVAWGDWDGDGDSDLAVGGGGRGLDTWTPNRIYLNHSIENSAKVNSLTRARITYPAGAGAPFFVSAVILKNSTLPITYTLFDLEGNPAHFVKAYYSLDDGSQWRPAIAATGTVTSNLAASPTGTVHTYIWDVLGSSFFGASDSVVFRLDVYQGFAGPGPYQYSFCIAKTLPFRVRGTQVRVINDAQPAGGAIVYRQPVGQGGVYQPYHDLTRQPIRTNPVGYLGGWGEIAVGDHLIALASITYTESYTLYYTNATPTLTGLDAYTVTAAGVQTLTVSADHPLVLFNLDVSLEWDARKDTTFLEQLEYDLARTSELLYDWTNGQAALGRVRVFHDREHWLDAHIRVYASNRLRPTAVKGGIASTIITDSLTTTLTYAPGQVRMGATWNRYGDPSGNLGEDWPRTLAHELGHFALFLDDNYLGFDGDGFLIPVEGCPGAMSDPYREDYPYDEFHPNQGWLPACKQTLSHQLTGRSDWSTIAAFYPRLNSTVTNTGPSLLPLAVTKMGFVEPITPPVTLEVPIFNLLYEGSRVVPGSSARAFLFQGDRLTDEGRPTMDQVLARGARPGDRLCVYEPDAERLGCETVDPPDLQLDLFDVTGWQPEVVVTPVTSRTVALTVTNLAPGLPLQARLYPVNHSATLTLTLIEAGDGYTGTLHLDQPIFEAYVHLWVAEPEPRRETVTEYALGGNPGHMWSRNAPRGSPGHMWSRNAPVISADGQVILYGQELGFEEGEFFALQAATHLPTVPLWATVVGQAYRLTTTPNAPDLSGASVSFGYLGNEVPPGEEVWLRVYYQDGEEWQVLPTELDRYHNVASAPAQGPGLYALMSSIEIPLYGPGWNLFAYPVVETRPVTEALLSISGYYTTLYGYEAADPADPWAVNSIIAPPWVDDLDVLEFGRGYWINVSETITLYLKGDGEYPLEVEGGREYPLEIEGSFPYPPAAYYGPVQSSLYFTPTAGMTVTVWVEGNLCGQGIVIEPVDYGVAYVVDVMADDGGTYARCGAPGRTVTFYIGSQQMAPTAAWNSNQPWEMPLSPIPY